MPNWLRGRYPSYTSGNPPQRGVLNTSMSTPSAFPLPGLPREGGSWSEGQMRRSIWGHGAAQRGAMTSTGSDVTHTLQNVASMGGGGGFLQKALPWAGAAAGAIGLVSSLTAENPYDDLRRAAQKRFETSRMLAEGRIARQQGASEGQLRQRLAGQGIGGMAYEQIARGYKADYGRRLDDTLSQVRGGYEAELAELAAGEADFRNQRRAAWGSLLGGQGVNLLLRSLERRSYE